MAINLYTKHRIWNEDRLLYIMPPEVVKLADVFLL